MNKSDKLKALEQTIFSARLLIILAVISVVTSFFTFIRATNRAIIGEYIFTGLLVCLVSTVYITIVIRLLYKLFGFKLYRRFICAAMMIFAFDSVLFSVIMVFFESYSFDNFFAQWGGLGFCSGLYLGRRWSYKRLNAIKK